MSRPRFLVYHDCIAHPDNDQGITEFEYYGKTVEEKAKEAAPPVEATPPPSKPEHLTVKIEIGDGTGEPTKVLLSVAGAA